MILVSIHTLLHALACVPTLKSNFLVSLQKNWPANFYEDFQDLWENLSTNHSELYIHGDFNLHFDIHSSLTTMIVDILTFSDFEQHVTFRQSLYIYDHWLDLLITRSTCNTIQTSTVWGVLSDHQSKFHRSLETVVRTRFPSVSTWSCRKPTLWSSKIDR